MNLDPMMKKATTNQPRLVFKQLNGFRAIDEQGKIKTILFLNASREVVALIGKIFNFFFGLLLFSYRNRCSVL